MSLSALTVKPLLYAAAALGLALLLSNAAWWARAAMLQGQRDSARAGESSLAVSRDAYKVRVDELAAANRVYDVEYGRLVDELKHAQAEAVRVSQQGEQAVAAAQAKATEADRVLKTFMDRYAQQLRSPDCAQALTLVQQMCPALEGY